MDTTSTSPDHPNRDFKNWKRAQDLLLASETRYRRLFETAQDGILILDAGTGQIVDANPFLINLLGFSHEQFLGKKIWEIGIFKDIVANKDNFKELQRKEYLRYEDLPLETADGRNIAVEFVSNVYLVDNKKVIQCNIRNITEQKLVEVERARLAAIEEYSEDALIAKTMDGIITSWNKGAERIYGYSAHEIVGQDIALLDPPAQLDDTRLLLERIRNGEPVIRYETVRRKKDGQLINISLTSSPIRNAQNHLIGVSTIAHDITTRKQTENELLLKNYVFESAHESNAIADLQGNVTHVNTAFMQLWGYPQKEDLIGRSISTFFADEQDALPVLEALDSTGRWEGEILVKRKDGSTLFSDCVATVILDETGKRIGFHSAHRDVTEERRIREALRESEERFRALFEEALDGVTLADAKTGIIIDCNPAMAAIAGRVRAELIGQSQSILHPADPGHPTITPTFRQHLTEKRGQILETQLVTKTGIIKEVEIKANILNIPGQEIMQGIFHDITDRKRAEEAKNASETRYRRLFETAQDGILILDAGTGQIVEVNPFLITMLGFSREQFLGKKLWEVGLFRDIAANKENFEELQRKEYIRYEDLPLETADGKPINVEFVSNVYMVNDRKVIQCNIRNITTRKRVEAALNATETRYRRLFETAQDGILILDAGTGQIVEVNPFLIDMLGFSREQFLGKKLWEVGLFRDIAANKENFEELQRKEYIRYENLPLETADGRTIAVEFVSNVYMVNDKKVIQCDIRDITERKKMSEQIEASLAEKVMLVKEVHHRVKNNLQIIVSLFNMQIRKTTDPQTIEALKDSQNRVRSMAIVHEHLYKGKDSAHINLGNYIRSLGSVIFSSYEVGNRGVTIDLNIHDIYVDTNTAIPLGLISNELITNSLKYAFKGKNDGMLSITATEDPAALTLVVADNGVGLAPEITLENQTSLGLHLVSTLTDQLNGTVAIDRMEGTKFTFTFPKPAEKKPTGKADP